MIALVHEAPAAPVEILRDRRGVVIGRLEHQRLTGRIVARDARGVVVGRYDERENLTRNASGRVIGQGNLLAALLLRL